MALVATGWDVLVTYIDRGANSTTRKFPIGAANADTYEHASVAAADIAAKAQAPSDCVVASYNLTQRFEENAFDLPVSATAEISTHAELTGFLEGYTKKTATVDIPGPKDSIWVSAINGPNYNVVNPANVAVAEFFGLFDGDEVTVSDGEAFDQTRPFTGKRTHSKSRKG